MPSQVSILLLKTNYNKIANVFYQFELLICFFFFNQVYEFDVEMTCGGCSGAVERVLGKKDGNNELFLNIIYNICLNYLFIFKEWKISKLIYQLKKYL